MKDKDIVKFRNPIDEEEEKALMIILEMRDDRVLVSDLRFSDWSVPPTDAYPADDLVVVEAGETAEHQI